LVSLFPFLRHKGHITVTVTNATKVRWIDTETDVTLILLVLTKLTIAAGIKHNFLWKHRESSLWIHTVSWLLSRKDVSTISRSQSPKHKLPFWSIYEVVKWLNWSNSWRHKKSPYNCFFSLWVTVKVMWVNLFSWENFSGHEKNPQFCGASCLVKNGGIWELTAFVTRSRRLSTKVRTCKFTFNSARFSESYMV